MAEPEIRTSSIMHHGFFCDARSDYDAGAARQAWALTLAFLDHWLNAP